MAHSCINALEQYLPNVVIFSGLVGQQDSWGRSGCQGWARPQEQEKGTSMDQYFYANLGLFHLPLGWPSADTNEKRPFQKQLAVLESSFE